MAERGYLMNPNVTIVLDHSTASAANGIALVTIPALPGRRWQPIGVYCGYNLDWLAGGSLLISWTKENAAHTFTWYVPVKSGSQMVPLPFGGIVGDENTEMTFSLAGGGAGVTGKVEVFYGGA